MKDWWNEIEEEEKKQQRETRDYWSEISTPSEQKPSQVAAQEVKPQRIDLSAYQPVETVKPPELTPITTTKPVVIEQPTATINLEEDGDIFYGIKRVYDSFVKGAAPAGENIKAGLTFIPELIDRVSIVPGYEKFRTEQAQLDIQKNQEEIQTLNNQKTQTTSSEELKRIDEDIKTKQSEITSLQEIQRKIQEPSAFDKYLLNTREEATQNAIRITKEEENKFVAKYGKPEPWGGWWIMDQVVSNTPQFLSSFGLGIAVGVITKNPQAAIAVGFPSSFVQESSGAYLAAREAGVNPDDSERIAINTAVPSAFIEQLPIANFLNRTPVGRIFKENVVKRIYNWSLDRAKDGLLEGSTETVQNLIQNFFAQEYDSNRKLYDGALESFVIGGILGIGGGAAGSIFTRPEYIEGGYTPVTDNRVRVSGPERGPDGAGPGSMGIISEDVESKPLLPQEETSAAITAVNQAFDTPAELRNELQQQIVATAIPEEKIAQAKIQEQQVTDAKTLIEKNFNFDETTKQDILSSRYIQPTPETPKEMFRGINPAGGRGVASRGVGLYMSPNEAVAREYAGPDGQVVPVPQNLRPKNPLTFKSVGSLQQFVLENASKYTDIFVGNKEYGPFIASLGYDGVITLDQNYYVKFPDTVLEAAGIIKKPELPAKTKAAKAVKEKKLKEIRKEPVEEKPAVTKTPEQIQAEEADIQSIKDALVEGTSEESAREFFNSLNITTTTFKNILADVKTEVKKQEEEEQFYIRVQMAESNRLLSDPVLAQYRNILLRGIRYWNLSKQQADFAKVELKVPGFDAALDALENAGYKFSDMPDIRTIYNNYLDAKQLLDRNEKRVNKLIREENKKRNDLFKNSISEASKNRGIVKFRTVEYKNLDDIQAFARKFDNWVDFYKNLNGIDKQLLINARNLETEQDWQSWFVGITGKRPSLIDNTKTIELEDIVLEQFGTTENPELAAFITSKGEIIDGGGPGATVRGYDHRALAAVAVPDLNYTDALIKYMNQTGNIRVSVTGDYFYVDIVYMPNAEQIAALEYLGDGRQIFLDYTASDGSVKNGSEFTSVRDLIRFLNGLNALNIDEEFALNEQQILVAPTYDAAEVYGIPFTDAYVYNFYKGLVEIPNVTERDSKFNVILKDYDRLMIDMTNPKISNEELHNRAGELQQAYYEWLNSKFRTSPEVEGYKFRIAQPEDALQIDPLNRKLTLQFLKIPEIKDSLPGRMLGKEYIKNLLISGKKRGVTDNEVQIINTLLDTTFKDVDRISKQDLEAEIKNSLLPLEVYESDKFGKRDFNNQWGTYGLDRINRQDQDGLVYMFNSPWQNNWIDHHATFWRDFSTKVFWQDIKPDAEKPLSWTPRFKTNGEFAHVRVSDTKTSIDGVPLTNVPKETFFLEVQSDPMQKGVGVWKPYVQLRMRIKDLKDSVSDSTNEMLNIQTQIEEKKLPAFILGSSWDNALNAAQMRIAALQESINTANKQIEIAQKELQDLKVSNYETKEEALYFTYKDNWYQRVIREIIYKKMVESKYDAIYFPTPRTEAYIQGYNGLSIQEEDSMPYRVISSGSPDYLVPGDLIDMNGERYMVLRSNQNEIEVAYADEVVVYTDAELRAKIAKNLYEEEIQDYLDSFGSYSIPMETTTDLKNYDKYAKLYWQIKQFGLKEIDLKNYDDTSYYARELKAFNSLEVALPKLKQIRDILSADYIRKNNLTKEDFYNGEKLDQLAQKLEAMVEYPGRTILLDNYQRSQLELSEVELNSPVDTPELLSAYVQEMIDGQISQLERVQERRVIDLDLYLDNYEKNRDEIANRKNVTPEDYKDLPEVFKEQLDMALESQRQKLAKSFYGPTINYEVNEFLTSINIDSIKDDMSLTKSTELYDKYQEYWKTRDYDYAEYLEGTTYQTVDANGEIKIYATEFSTEELGQPANFEQTLTPENNYVETENGEYVLKKEITDKFSGNQKGVMYVYDKKMLPFFKKERPNAQLVTDENGLQWYKSERLPEDDLDPSEFFAYRTVENSMRAANLKSNKETIDKLLKLSKRFFGDANIKVVQQIMYNKDILGASGKDMIYIVEGQARPEDTFYHEAVHRFIGTFLTLQEHTKLFDVASQKYGTTDRVVLEERIAEDFISYFNERASIKGTIKSVFELLATRIASYFKNIDEIDALYKELAVPAPIRKAITKAVPKGEKIKVSTLGLKVEARAVAASIVTEVENLPEYKQMNLEDQGAKALNFLEQSPEEAVAVALGQAQPPAGIIPEAVFIAVENKAIAEGDAETIRQLATSPRVSEATSLGQRIRMLGERNADSPVARITEIVEARKQAIEQARGISLEKETAKLKKSVESEVKKIKKGDWEAFIDSIQC